MWFAIGKTVIAAIILSYVSWLSGKKTILAGFLTSLPLMSVIALAFSQAEWGDQKQTVEYAKSIFTAVPLTLSFFVPFLFAEKFNLNFWTCYFTGLVLLVLAYFAHVYINKSI